MMCKDSEIITNKPDIKESLEYKLEESDVEDKLEFEQPVED